MVLAYTEDSVWRNRTEFPVGRDQIRGFLAGKWERELDYRLVKALWAFTADRIAVKFEYEWHDRDGHWFRSYGNELWEFDERGLMRRREASINDRPIAEADRKFFWPAPGPSAGRSPRDRVTRATREKTALRRAGGCPAEIIAGAPRGLHRPGGSPAAGPGRVPPIRAADPPRTRYRIPPFFRQHRAGRPKLYSGRLSGGFVSRRSCSRSDKFRRRRAWTKSSWSSLSNFRKDRERWVIPRVNGRIRVRAGWWVVGRYFLRPSRPATYFLQSAISSISIP